MNCLAFISRRLRKTESYIMCLPIQKQNLLNEYKSNFKYIKECLDKNQVVIDNIVQGVPYMFENVNSDFLDGVDELASNIQFSHEEMEKVEAVLKQLFREWSKSGQEERNASFQPILDEIALHFPKDKCVPHQINVLVPGAGLGRLAFEVARLGYSCQGNEFSLYMLFASNFLLNRCSGTSVFTIHPWVHHFCNNLNIEAQSYSIDFPDVDPLELRGKKQSFSMTAGDFVEIYNTANEWDCVASCFFIDCVSNIVDVIETIYKILKPGGIWVNLGPLMYHFSLMEDSKVVNPSYQDVKSIILGLGFQFEKEKLGIKTSYCQNPESMMKSYYESVFFVCCKPLDCETIETDSVVRAKEKSGPVTSNESVKNSNIETK
ncbi:carnosine N-methyltransferase isoform X2 [Lycorma delicatula]|uniref:carnosine N-methyltransferase isoform X2 n=1 Tax=Lycorma delicatula TaxID=130591 RepID=UPI003F50FD94